MINQGILNLSEIYLSTMGIIVISLNLPLFQLHTYSPIYTQMINMYDISFWIWPAYVAGRTEAVSATFTFQSIVGLIRVRSAAAGAVPAAQRTCARIKSVAARTLSQSKFDLQIINNNGS